MLYLTRNFFNPRTFIRFFQINKKIFIRNPKILNILKYPSKSALGKVEGQKEQNRSAFRKKSGKFIDYTRTFAEKSVVLKKNICTGTKANAKLALLLSNSGKLRFILQPAKMENHSIIYDQTNQPESLGDSAYLRDFNPGSLLHNVSLVPKSYGQLSRCAGNFVGYVRHDATTAHGMLKLKSGELKMFPDKITASLGIVGNENLFLKERHKAGFSRKLGIRPRTRPSAMNPVDHPMGGRTKGGSQPVTSKGLLLFHRSTKKYYNPNIIRTKRQLKFK